MPKEVNHLLVIAFVGSGVGFEHSLHLQAQDAVEEKARKKEIIVTKNKATQSWSWNPNMSV